MRADGDSWAPLGGGATVFGYPRLSESLPSGKVGRVCKGWDLIRDLAYPSDTEQDITSSTQRRFLVVKPYNIPQHS